MRGWESQRSSAPLYPRGSVTGSRGENDEGGPTEEDFGEAMLNCLSVQWRASLGIVSFDVVRYNECREVGIAHG